MDRNAPAYRGQADDTRIDRWLCAVRLVKTRPMATQLCDGGHVRVNGNPAKPSTKVRAGDVVHALIAEHASAAPLGENPAPVTSTVRSASPWPTAARLRCRGGHKPYPLRER